MVASAVASIQGARKAAGKLPLSSYAVRDLLRNTGTPQTQQVTQRPIGPMPNIKAALINTGTNVIAVAAQIAIVRFTKLFIV